MSIGRTTYSGIIRSRAYALTVKIEAGISLLKRRTRTDFHAQHFVVSISLANELLQSRQDIAERKGEEKSKLVQLFGNQRSPSRATRAPLRWRWLRWSTYRTAGAGTCIGVATARPEQRFATVKYPRSDASDTRSGVHIRYLKTSSVSTRPHLNDMDSMERVDILIRLLSATGSYSLVSVRAEDEGKEIGGTDARYRR